MSRPTVRILIVDDHAMVRRGVRALVESKPCFQVVGEAADGVEAVEVACRTKPDIAILDYSLPQRNGLIVMQKLMSHLPRLQVLIFTLHDEEALVSEVIRAGVRGFILKSEAEDQMLDALDSLSIGRRYFSSAISESLLERFLANRPDGSRSSLSPREREVVQLIAEGRLNKQIGYSLEISIKTVETHRASAMHKLHLRTTADLVRYAVRNHLVQA
jgi:DNA-binding NarL/FixJ family response regulator